MLSPTPMTFKTNLPAASCPALAGYGVIMAFMYPIMVDNDELFRQYTQTFPEEFLVAFGMTGSLRAFLNGGGDFLHAGIAGRCAEHLLTGHEAVHDGHEPEDYGDYG